MTVDRHVRRDRVERARDALDKRLALQTLTLPEDWTLTSSWQRAQLAPATCEPSGPATFRVLMGYLDHDGVGDEHDITFTIYDDDLVAECSCSAYTYPDWCAHVARLWWEWVRDGLCVTDLDTGHVHTAPPDLLALDDHSAPTPTSASRGVARTDGGQRR